MTLGDLANAALTELQQPGASFTVGGGGGPNWAGQTNPQFSQGLIEFWINEAYKKVLGDLEDLELALVSCTITSVAQTYKYAIPATNYAPISHVARVFYQPKGLPYSREFRPGRELTSWSQYQTFTGQGYLLPYSFRTQPRIATVDPLLQNLYFYPGSSIAGDTITVEYAPLPAKGATGCPTLVNATDVPLLPTDCHTAILYFALARLWMRARERVVSADSMAMYKDELKTIRAKYTKKHHGDTMRIEPFEDSLSLSGLT